MTRADQVEWARRDRKVALGPRIDYEAMCKCGHRRAAHTQDGCWTFDSRALHPWCQCEGFIDCCGRPAE